MAIAKDKKRVLITLRKDKLKALRAIAKEKDLTLSQLLSTACDTSTFINSGGKDLK